MDEDRHGIMLTEKYKGVCYLTERELNVPCKE